MFRAFTLAVLLVSLSPLLHADDTVAVVYLSADDSLPIGKAFYEGDHIITSEGVMLKLPDGSDVELDRATNVRLSQMRRTPRGTQTRIELNRGAFRAKVPVGQKCEFRVVTPIAVTGVRGTDFSVVYTPTSPTATVINGEVDVDVFEGSVDVERDGGEPEVVGAGDGATVNRRRTMRRKVKDEVRERWENRRGAIIERMRQKLNLGPDGDIGAAIRERLKNLPPEKREEIRRRLEGHVKRARERAGGKIKERAREQREEQERPRLRRRNR